MVELRNLNKIQNLSSFSKPTRQRYMVPTIVLVLALVTTGHTADANTNGWGLPRRPTTAKSGAGSERGRCSPPASAYPTAILCQQTANANPQQQNNHDDSDDEDDSRMEYAFWKAASPQEQARLRHVEDSFSIIKATKKNPPQTELEHLESLALPCGAYRDHRRSSPSPSALVIET